MKEFPFQTILMPALPVSEQFAKLFLAYTPIVKSVKYSHGPYSDYRKYISSHPKCQGKI